MPHAYIGLGSNLNNPKRQIENALVALESLDQTQVLRSSRLYRSTPWGNNDQPEFVNAVTEIQTTLNPSSLLEKLLAIERRFGRKRDADRWGPRILDLDILLYGSQVVEEPHLKIPHLHFCERAFVLLPLSELAPMLEIPGYGNLSALLLNVDLSTCTSLFDLQV